MQIQLQQLFKAIIVGGFAVFFIRLHYTGEIVLYINPKYVLMSQIAACAFVFFFLVQVCRIWHSTHTTEVNCMDCCSHNDQKSGLFPKRLLSYLIIIFPLITAFTLSPTILDASIAAKKGTLLPQLKDDYLEDPPEEYADHYEILENNNYLTNDAYEAEMAKLAEMDAIKMDGDLYAPYYEAISTDPQQFIGRKITFSGFVYKEAGLAENQLVLSRFIITHCIADATVVGFLTEFDEANAYEADSWIEMSGTLDVTTYNGEELPVVKVTSWKATETPLDPYIFPILINLVE